MFSVHWLTTLSQEADMLQVLLCYADDTLEPTNTRGEISGYSERQCRNSTELYRLDALGPDRNLVLTMRQSHTF